MLNYYYKLFPEKIYKNNNEIYFFINDDKYYIKDIKNIEALDEYIMLSQNFNKKSIKVNEIIMNKENEFKTKYDNKNYLIVKVNEIEQTQIKLIDIEKYISTDVNNYKKIEINELEQMKKEVDNYEELIVNYNKEFPIIQNISNYIIGLAENSISYLSDTIKECGDGIKSTSHNKIDDTYKLLIDIFNFNINYRLKDIIEYIRLLYIQNKDWEEQLEVFLKSNTLLEFEYRFLYSEILYPKEYFDEISYLISNNKDYIESTKIYEKIKKNENKLKIFYNIVNKYYKIPSIWWLND